MEEIFESLKNNPQFLKAAESIKTYEDLVAVLKGFGVEMSAEQLNEISLLTGKDGELSEDSLDMVAGGSWFNSWVDFIKSLFGGQSSSHSSCGSHKF